MLRIVAEQAPPGWTPIPVGVDLIKEHESLPTRENLPLAPSLVMMMPLKDDVRATVALDARKGAYLTKRHTRALANHLRRDLWPSETQVQKTSLLVFDELAMNARFRAPPAVIPFMSQFYFALGSARHRDAAWIAGQYLYDFSVVSPGTVRLEMRMTEESRCTVELSIPRQMDAAKLSLLTEYAAAVTRRVQPLHLRFHARPMAGAMVCEAPPGGNYAPLVLPDEWPVTRAPGDVLMERLETHWEEITVLIRERAVKFDFFLFEEELRDILRQE